MDAWPSYQGPSRWTLDTLGERFGPVVVSIDHGREGRVSCTLAEYLAFVRNFSTEDVSVVQRSAAPPAADLAFARSAAATGDLGAHAQHDGRKDGADAQAEPGVTYEESSETGRPEAGGAGSRVGGKTVPYLRTWNFDDDCPALMEEFCGEPYFSDLFKKLPVDMQPPFTWLFVGPPGVATRLHVDIWETDAWLAQFEGRKRFTLFHPAHLPFVSRQGEDGQRTFADPLNPDLQAFPDFPRAIPVTATLHPGEVIYLPRKWPHHVAGVDATLSLTSNFLCPPNRLRLLGTVGAYMARRRQCQDLLGRPLRAKDNLMKFCVHGGKIDIVAAQAVMGKALGLLGGEAGPSGREPGGGEEGEEGGGCMVVHTGSSSACSQASGGAPCVALGAPEEVPV
eukprot:jgi/Mesvir1/13824/Mv15975-RA.1